MNRVKTTYQPNLTKEKSLLKWSVCWKSPQNMMIFILNVFQCLLNPKTIFRLLGFLASTISYKWIKRKPYVEHQKLKTELVFLTKISYSRAEYSNVTAILMLARSKQWMSLSPNLWYYFTHCISGRFLIIKSKVTTSNFWSSKHEVWALAWHF